jgi:hypothetical protein
VFVAEHVQRACTIRRAISSRTGTRSAGVLARDVGAHVHVARARAARHRGELEGDDVGGPAVPEVAAVERGHRGAVDEVNDSSPRAPARPGHAARRSG